MAPNSEVWFGMRKGREKDRPHKGEFMGNTAKTVLLLGLISGLLLTIGELLGGANGLVIAFGFAVVMNFGSYWFSDRIVSTSGSWKG